MTTAAEYRRKLIEVDLPLMEINLATAEEPTASSGHPWRIHSWWARRPLAVCRAVIFASLVDDPCDLPEEFSDEATQRKERERLHGIIKELAKWESTDESKPGGKALMGMTRYEIAKSIARSRGEIAPTDPAQVLSYLNASALPIYDPFAGGGSIPLEVQRLGLKAIATDLNPIAVLINKALIEIPPKFRNRPPVNPNSDSMGNTAKKGRSAQRVPWRGAAGLANDIRYYGQWMRKEAFKRVGYLVPTARLPGGTEATVIAWLWARCVPCPNPACGINMPLLRTFQLSKKRGNAYWTRPVVDRNTNNISWIVQDHPDGVQSTGTVNVNGATCIGCGGTVGLVYVRSQARAGKMGEQMTAIVAEGERKRLFLSPTSGHIQTARAAKAPWRPSGNLPERALGFRVQAYGFTEWHQLFTERQLSVLTTFAELVPSIRALAVKDGATREYSDAICTYLAFAIGKLADGNCKFVRWQNAGGSVAGLFSRQAISMVWDFAETNSFSNSAKNWMSQVELVAKSLEKLPVDTNPGEVHQADASTTIHGANGPIIVTDPPYYDNIGYAALSDFFYVWIRPILRDVYPLLFAGISTPKKEEMIAEPGRFDNAKQHFEDLLSKTLCLIRNSCSNQFPSSIFYAYKQQEEKRGSRTSTGWESMLNALVTAGFQIVGTWPMRTEKTNRQRSLRSNALASSVVLVCRRRPQDAPVATRRQFFDALEKELPEALDQLTREGHIAPTDIAQAAIGPGMEIYSRYRRVETISGDPVPVREALAAINKEIADYDERQEGDLDAETRFCIDWLKQYGHREGQYGEADTLARAKNVAIGNLQNMNRLLTAEGGRVKLLPVDEFGESRPLNLGNITAWEGCFRMTYHMNREEGGGIEGAANVASAMSGRVDSIERLARILYNHYNRKGDAQDAIMFNNLVTSWPAILARIGAPEQGGLFAK